MKNCIRFLLGLGLSFCSSAYAAYAVNITNNYAFPIQTSFGNTIKSGISWQTTRNAGNFYVTIPGYGPIVFQDLAEDHITGDSQETLGILISYRGRDTVARYPVMDGKLQLTIGLYGQAVLKNITPMTLTDVFVSRFLCQS